MGEHHYFPMTEWKVLYIGKEEKLPRWLHRLVSHSSNCECVDSIESGIEKLRDRKYDLLIIGLERFHDAVRHHIREIAKEINPEMDIIYTKHLSSTSAPIGFYCKAARLEEMVKNSRFWGVSESHDFLSLIEGIGVISHSAALTIISGDFTGVVYFKEGKILHAQAGDAKGREAFSMMLSWKGGIYFVEEGIEPPEVTIDAPVDSLLLEIISQMEEAKNSYDQFIKILLMELPGDIHWGAVITNGKVVGALGEGPKGPILEFITQFCSKLESITGKLNHINIEFEKYWVTLRRLSENSFVVVSFNGNPYIVDYALQKNLEKYGVHAIKEIEKRDLSPMEFSFEKFEELG